MSRSSTSSSDAGRSPRRGLDADELVWTGDGADRPRGFLRPLVIVWLGLLVLVPVVDTLFPAAVARPSGLEAEREARRSATATWRNGSRARLFEEQMRQASQVRRELGGRYGFLLYRAGFVDRRLLVGASGWLYLNDRMRPRPGTVNTVVGPPARLLAAISRRLASHGAAVHVAVVPRKSRIAPDGFPESIVPAPELYQALLRQLADHGVAATDLEAALLPAEREAFYKLDSHWSDTGSQLAALAVCRDLGLLPKNDLPRLRLATGEPIRRQDLLTLLGIGGSWARDIPDSTRARGLLLNRHGASLDPLDNFLVRGVDDATRLDWILVGTSYSARTFFPAALAQCGDRPLVNAALGGLGPIPPLRALDWPLPGPKQVLLEVPAHFVFTHTLPEAGDFLAELPSGLITNSLSDEQQFGRVEISATTTRPRSEVLVDSIGEVAHTGGGTVALRLRGHVSRPLRLQVDTGSMRYRALWNPERTEILLPVLGLEPTDRLRVTAELRRGTRIAIESFVSQWVAEVDARRSKTLEATVDDPNRLSVHGLRGRLPPRTALQLDCPREVRLERWLAFADSRTIDRDLGGVRAATWIVELDALRGHRLSRVTLFGEDALDSCSLSVLTGPIAPPPRRSRSPQLTGASS